MKTKEFINNFEKFVPPEIAWPKDNIGLQIGDKNQNISNILCSLDLNEYVISDAIKNRCNLIVSHHPLIFKELKKVLKNDRVGNLIQLLIKNKINLYVAHTNFDSVKDGVNFKLAELIGLKNLKILDPVEKHLYKIIVFVPSNSLEKVADAMFNAGAGEFSKYKNCSFQTDGIGTFFPKENAQPSIGKIGKLEKVAETKLEMICEFWKLPFVLDAMRKSHPYEEIAFDYFKIENKSNEFGLGVIGNFNKELSKNNFLSLIKNKLKIKFLKYSDFNSDKIKTVAVCGGSGSDLISTAINNKADAFVTADLKYHTFQEFENRILLIDSGHYETESIALVSLCKFCFESIDNKKIKVFKTQINTNPIKYF